MKKSIIPFILFIAAAVQAQAITYNCTHKGDKPWGAKTVEETPIPGGEGFNLVCTDPGDKVCRFSDGHCPPKIKLQQIQAEVTEAISHNILSGKVETAYGYYTWDASSTEDYTISITDFEE